MLFGSSQLLSSLNFVRYLTYAVPTDLHNIHIFISTHLIANLIRYFYIVHQHQKCLLRSAAASLDVRLWQPSDRFPVSCNNTKHKILPFIVTILQANNCISILVYVYLFKHLSQPQASVSTMQPNQIKQI